MMPPQLTTTGDIVRFKALDRNDCSADDDRTLTLFVFKTPEHKAQGIHEHSASEYVDHVLRQR